MTKTLAAVLLLAASITAPATAHAACGDPDQPPCTGPAPTVDQVTAIMDRLFDPNVPAPDKSDIVTPAFADNEFQIVDCMTGTHLFLSTPWIVTDIQPAPNNFAGATVAKPGGFRVPPPKPIVLVEQDSHWKMQHRYAMYMLNEFYSADIGVRAIARCWP